MNVDMNLSVEENLKLLEDKIKKACDRSNRDPKEIIIIGITKYVTIERAKEAIEAGIVNLGENRDNEFLAKYNEIGSKANWHFVGTLQSRKVRDVVNKVTAIHSVERMSVVKQIQNRAENPVDCFIQVNISGEERKHGLSPDEVIPFIEESKKYPKARIVGLMTMAPHTEDELVLRKVFQDLALLRDKIADKNYEHAPCKYLSMGMSNDFEIAIEEGATHIRIGSDLVGGMKKN